VFGCSAAGGEFIITHAPSYMTFLQGSSQLANSEISDVIKSVYGFSLSKVCCFSPSLLTKLQIKIIIYVGSDQHYMF